MTFLLLHCHKFGDITAEKSGMFDISIKKNGFFDWTEQIWCNRKKEIIIKFIKHISKWLMAWTLNKETQMWGHLSDNKSLSSKENCPKPGSKGIECIHHFQLGQKGSGSLPVMFCDLLHFGLSATGEFTSLVCSLLAWVVLLMFSAVRLVSQCPDFEFTWCFF